MAPFPSFPSSHMVLLCLTLHAQHLSFSCLDLEHRLESVRGRPWGLEGWLPQHRWHAVFRLFVFGQVRAQGEESTAARVIDGRLPLDHIPELMCALGCYATQADITDMIACLAHAAALTGAPKPTDISFETFLFLLYNFKPVQGVRCCSPLQCRRRPRNRTPACSRYKQVPQVLLEQIEKAFVTLGAARPKARLTAPQLIEAVTTLGETMDMEELSEAMRLLTGKEQLTDAMPAQLTPLSFATDVLGFEAAA